jgi:hypothetical protein
VPANWRLEKERTARIKTQHLREVIPPEELEGKGTVKKS